MEAEAGTVQDDELPPMPDMPDDDELPPMPEMMNDQQKMLWNKIAYEFEGVRKAMFAFAENEDIPDAERWERRRFVAEVLAYNGKRWTTGSEKMLKAIADAQK